MSTKDQERKALEQIRKIVEGLGGASSYVGMAFDGCFKIAEENIENDWGGSMRDNWQSALKEQGKLREICAEDQESIRKQKQEIERLEQELQEANEDAQEWKKQYDRMHDKATDYANKATENWNNFREQEDKVAALELENMKLKAKLYDMMVGA